MDDWIPVIIHGLGFDEVDELGGVRDGHVDARPVGVGDGGILVGSAVFGVGEVPWGFEGVRDGRGLGKRCRGWWGWWRRRCWRTATAAAGSTRYVVRGGGITTALRRSGECHHGENPGGGSQMALRSGARGVKGVGRGLKKPKMGPRGG